MARTQGAAVEAILSSNSWSQSQDSHGDTSLAPIRCDLIVSPSYPGLIIAVSEGVLSASKHTGQIARLLLEPVCLCVVACVVGGIAPHRVPAANSAP